MTAMLVVFAGAIAVLAYIYAGYPLLLRVVVLLRGARRVRKAEITPSLTLVISAFNEAGVIRQKLDNALSLTYPREALEIVVISDASDDGTDAIVAEFADRGVTLMRQTSRGGKTAGLNRCVPLLKGDIVVFSDANAMYQSDALLKLARNFADSEVGCVTGEARYVAGNSSAADVGERAYWDYEIQIKRLETALGSMVGGDGAIYAIRRALWKTLPDNAINDFLNPLQIVEAGWRAVYEPEAVCFEETAGGIRTEYRRRVRIVSRSWRAVFQARGVLNPLQVGLFTWSLVSHKMLRWLSGILAGIAGVTGLILLVDALAHNAAATFGAVLLLVAAFSVTPAGRRAAAVLAYVATIYAASVVGVIRGSFGQVSGIWNTPRQAQTHASSAGLVPVGRWLQTGVGLVVMAAVVAIPFVSPSDVALLAFWTSILVLGYVYIGYPLLLGVMRRLAARPVRPDSVEPHVTIFIAANDEGAVMDAKLRNTLALDYPADKLDVVIASDGSVDETNDIVRRFAPRVRLLEYSPRRGKIATINTGMHEVAGEIVVFSDANTFLQPDALRAIVRNFADPDVGAVSGDVVLVGERASLGRSEDLYYRYERWVQRAESEIGSMIGADGALYAIRRELFTPPAADTILDDMSIPMAVVQAGRRVVFEESARATEHGSETAFEEFSRKVRVVAGAMQFLGRRDCSVPLAAPQVLFSLVSHKALRWFSPVFAAAALVSSLFLAGTSTFYAVAVLGQISLLLLAAVGCVPSLRRIAPVAIAHYFWLVQAAAFLGLLRGLSGRQSVLWRRFARTQAPAGDGVAL